MKEESPLFTDFYSLTMAQGYWKNGMNRRAVFEMFFRKHPFNGGFSLFAGLGTLLKRLCEIRFAEDDLEFLSEQKVFEKGFLDYLKDFRFTGNVWAFEEGSVIFPNEPLIRVEGNFIECQIIEGMLLNIINFQSLVATKTARVYLASKKGNLFEFGLRRAQGPDGALSASRAAYIGGAMGTSNVKAARVFNIPAFGTMAHSWIMAFPNEEEAFRAYADIYPDRSIFLIDTYNTLKNGIINAVKVGKELAAKGKKFGVRLDSGDIHYLSVEVRRILDEAGLTMAEISVSNDLDEYIIQTLTAAGAPIDSWGVGTQMVTGGREGAFPGVYKLAAIENEKSELNAVMKFSDNPEKTSNPGVKQVWRISDQENLFAADILALDDEEKSDTIEKGNTYTFWHPSADYRHFSMSVNGNAAPLLVKKLDKGVLTEKAPPLEKVRAYAQNQLDMLDQSYKRLLNPHVYKVSATAKLRSLKLGLIENYLGST